VNAIVIPCYNKDKRLEAATFVSFLADNPDVGFVFVDDGSTDRTADKLSKICDQAGQRATLVRLADNRGKAEAVRSGVQAALAEAPTHVDCWDRDLATPLSEIPESKIACSYLPQIPVDLGRIYLHYRKSMH